MEVALNPVEGRKLGARREGLDDDFLALDLGQVKAMERLTEGMENKVGDVNYVVDRALANGRQQVLEPFGAKPNSNAIRATDCSASSISISGFR